METWPFLAVLGSALLHAVWNAAARSGVEPGEVMACGVVVSGGVGLAGLLFAGLPDSPSLPWLVGGVVINTIGIRFAMAAYRSASFGLAYPVMRAGIPLLVLPIGVVVLGQWPGPIGVVGVLLVAAALIMLAFAASRAGRGELRGVGFALLAAMAGAGYVSADAVGVRLSGNVLGYAFLVTIGNALAIWLLSAAEGRNLILLLPRHAKRAVFISLVSTASFLLYLDVVARNPVALAAALRETSVLFAVAIARFALGERIGPFHWGAATLALAGVAAIRLA
jgi:drug/metabolite transporter (DMT)-like permease